FVAASASFCSRTQRAREPDSGVSNPTTRYVCPFARTVSPSTTEIDTALVFDSGPRVSISICKNAATTRTANAATATVYFRRYRQAEEYRLLARILIMVISAAVSNPYALRLIWRLLQR